MGIRIYKAYTPGTRNRSVSDSKNISSQEPEKSLTSGKNSKKGRNNQGIITSRHRGGGHKRLYRQIDFRRSKLGVSGKIISIEYDPNRNSYISLVNYNDGEKRYIIYPRGIQIGDKILSSIDAPIFVGNTLPLTQIPLGTAIHNIELQPGKGGQLVRAAGAVAQVVAKEGKWTSIRLPSGEVRLISQKSLATIGQVGNQEFNNQRIGKAGSQRWRGKRPHVRGTVMNPVDHPHGGGEGRTSIGRKRPLTPWGYPTLGSKTRQKNKYSNIFIVRKRNIH
uniref:ribosomal protein L2 n=1 Tax=Nitella hyalina TaxID=181804 RepID=UPI002869F1F6|nr:ribosomal protein L2 [Nitella hyalina]WKT08411.1 ribosomal protein L2 [Nitella hyalina]